MRSKNLTVRPGKPEGPRRPGVPPFRDSTVALLGGCCFFLSTLEYLIPKPFPFMRIGLANMPLIVALDILSVKKFALLVFIKILGQGLITGSLFSYVFIFSLAGTLASGTAMYLLRRCLGPRRIGFIGISTAGAFLSNGVQLALAGFFIFGEGAKFIAPPLLGAGVLTGMVLGLFCEIFIARSAWYRTRRGPLPGDGIHPLPRPVPPPDPSDRVTPLPGNSGGKKAFPDRDLLAAGLIMMTAFLFNPSTLTRGIQFLLFGLYARLTGKKIFPLITLCVMAVIIFCNLLVPYGRVLAEFGPLRLTQGSLLSGLHKAVTLEGLILLSKAAIGSDLRFPGTFGFFIGESFRLFYRLTEQRGRLSRKHLIEGIDALMVELSAGEESAAGNPPKTEPARKPKRTVSGVLLLAGAALFTLALTLIGLAGSGSTGSDALPPDPLKPLGCLRVIGVEPQGPLVGLYRRNIIAHSLPDRPKAVPPEGYAGGQLQGGGIGDIGMAESPLDPEGFSDEKIGRGGLFPMGKRIDIPLHKTEGPGVIVKIKIGLSHGFYDAVIVGADPEGLFTPTDDFVKLPLTP